MLLHAVTVRKTLRAVAVELGLKFWMERHVEGNLYAVDLAPATVDTLYLFP